MALDLVRDMRDHLHRGAEVIATPLLHDDVVVHLAGRENVGFGHVAPLSKRWTLATSSGVSTPVDTYGVGTTLMRYPCSSARSCSSCSRRSSGVCGNCANVSRNV